MPVIGTDGADDLKATFGAFSDVVRGLAGNDTLSGVNQMHLLEGGPGDDLLTGSTASYASASGGVNASLRISGPQAVGGGEGLDTFRNLIGLSGSAYNDTLIGYEATRSYLSGGQGADSLLGGQADDILDGGDGADTIDGAGGGTFEQVRGGAGDDRLTSRGEVFGGEGRDYISTGYLGWGGVGDDTLIGTTTAADFFRSAFLHGGVGDDSIVGSDFADFLYSGGGDNTVLGGLGDDQFFVNDGGYDDLGGGGNNRIDGGAGSDTINYGLGHSTSAYGWIGVTLDLEAGVARTLGGEGYGPLGRIVVGPTSDTFTSIENAAGSMRDDVMYGSSADNRLFGYLGADTIYGRAGNDTISGDGKPYSNLTSGTVDGSSVLRGDEGDDSIMGAGGFDDMHGNMGSDTLIGYGGDDWVVGGKNEDLLYGSDGNDIVHGSMGADTCYGDWGDDIVRGGQDNDMLYGGDGDDLLFGDRGADTIYGGTGGDAFVLFDGAGLDRVMDFNFSDGDVVVIEGSRSYTVAQQGADTVISLGANAQMVLVGVSASSLPAGWILTA